MARDLEKKDLEFEQCVIALAKVMETAQVGTGISHLLTFPLCCEEFL